MTLRIAVVGASPLVADGIRAALGGSGDDDDSLGILVVPPARLTDAGIAAAVVHARDSDDALALCAALPPGLPAVVLGDDLREIAARGAADARPLGLLVPGATAAQLRAALAAVLQGLTVHDPALLAAPARSASALAPAAPDHEPLTPRELEVFELLGKGLSNPDIARVLGISAHTAKFHVGQILAKVGAATRAEAVATGLRLGVIGL